MPTATAADARAGAVAPPRHPPVAAGQDSVWWHRARRHVPAQSVAAFRICFGLLVAYSSIRFLAKGWVDSLYLGPAHHLTYVGFEWVRPWPAPWMHLHVAGLAILGLVIAAGYRTRLCAALFTVGFAYTELIDAALYLNHYWFVTLVGVLLVLLPTGHHWSVDAATGRVAAAATVPVGAVWALRAQVAVVYCFAGLAKWNPDWLLRAKPMRLWLADHGDVALVGPLLDEPWVAHAASWAGMAFDCSVVALLLRRRTRPFAFFAVVGFHLVTGMLFPIGVFPWVMIAGALLFFPPTGRAGLPPTSAVGPRRPAPTPVSVSPRPRRSASDGSR